MNEQTRQALEMAIEALEDVHWSERTVKMENAIAPCKEALEDISKMETTSQPAQEPVAWECFSDAAYYDMWAIRQIGNRNFDETIHVVNGKEAKHLCAWLNSLNTHPAQARQWVGLSDGEMKSFMDVWGITKMAIQDLEASFKDKNT